MTERIPVVICVDVEPDERTPDPSRRDDWKGFESSFDFFAELRPRAEGATASRASFSWFIRMDPQVAHVYGSPAWAAQRYAAQLGRLQTDGDELGLHTHAWRWDAGLGRWVSDYADQRWVEHCVRLSFGAFAETFGRPCRSHRGGDGWMNTETLALAEGLGARFDLTPEPGQRSGPPAGPAEISLGERPDYAGMSLTPYRPSASDFRLRETGPRRDMWVLPVSGVAARWPSAPFYRRALWRVRYGPRPHVRLGLDILPSDFRPLVEKILAGPEPFLCAVMRTDAWAAPSQVRTMRENLEFLLSHPLAARMAFVGPASAVAMFDGAGRGGPDSSARSTAARAADVC